VTTRNYGGTGLGLPITKGLVEAHGGTLTIDSRAGRGTIVRIVLPRLQ
jgi:signal transduction histidine kinase